MAGRPRNAEPLTVESIVDSAIRLARKQDLSALRMRDLAAELGVSLGAVYHHVPNQAALQAAVVEHVLAGVPGAQSYDAPPREQITLHVRALQRALDEHPGLTASVLASANSSAEGRRLRGDLRAALQEAGLDGEAAQQAYTILTWYWLGFRTQERRSRTATTTFEVGLAALLSGLLSPEG